MDFDDNISARNSFCLFTSCEYIQYPPHRCCSYVGVTERRAIELEALSCGAGVPGDEEGYVVKMTDGDPSPPYLIQPGTNVRLFSDYDGSERRLGESPLTSPPTSTTLSLLGTSIAVAGCSEASATDTSCDEPIS